MRKLLIEVVFNSGETTCWNKKTKKWCEHVFTTRFGTEWQCGVFGKPLCDEWGVPSGPGTLQRLPECMKYEVK